MSNDTGTGGGAGRLSCPRCGCDLEISALMRQQLEGEIQTRLRGELAAANQEIQAKLTAAAHGEAAVIKRQRELEAREQQLGLEQERRISEAVARIREQELTRVQAQAAAETVAAVAAKEAELVALQAKLAAAAQGEASVLRRQRELEEKEQQLGLAAEQTIQAEVARIREQEHRRAAEQAAVAAVERAAEAAVKEAELATMQAKLADAARAEAGVLKRQRELEEREQQLGVEQERRINEEVARIREQEQKRAAEQAAVAAVQRAAEAVVKEAEVATMQAKLAAAAQSEAAVLKRQRELAEREQQLAVEVEQRLQAEVAQIRAQDQKRAAEAATAAAAERAAEAATREAEEELLQAKLAAAAQSEAAMLKRQRELAEREQQLAGEVERKLQAEVAQIRAQEQQRAEERASVDRATREAEEVVLQAKLAAAAQSEAAALERQRALAEREQQLGLEVEQKLRAEVAQIRAQEVARAQAKAAEDTAVQVAAKEVELVVLQAKLTEAARGEAAVLKRERELEEREQQQLVAHEQRLLEEGRRLREQSAQQLQERLQAQQAQQQLESEEQRLRMETLQRKLDDMQRSVAQGSQQTQGEAQEVVLRDQLATAFPQDALGDVGKGILGADVVQRVHMPNGGDDQIILWESKRTKGWSNGWIPKLREDQAEARAAVAVIVTQVMPPGVNHFGLFEGVWVCAWAYAVPLAAALRSGMIDLALARRASEGRGEKMEMLYAYLTGPEFRLRVTGLVEALKDLESDLRTERSWMMTRWKKREKQLQRAQANLSAFSGDLKGIGGSNLPEVELLELGYTPPVLEAGDDDDDGLDDDADPDALASTRPEDPQLIELLHDLLPAGGAGISNHALSDRFLDLAKARSGLVLHAGDYERCKRLLIASGRARRGKGRGGSVARVAPDVTS